jgi:hypothetical protein
MNVFHARSEPACRERCLDAALAIGLGHYPSRQTVGSLHDIGYGEQHRQGPGQHE